MRNCEPYTEVSKETLNPHYYLQQGTAQFDDEEYKRANLKRGLNGSFGSCQKSKINV